MNTARLTLAVALLALTLLATACTIELGAPADPAEQLLQADDAIDDDDDEAADAGGQRGYFMEEVAGELTSVEADGGYADYHSISDDSGAITVSVPVEWADVDGGRFVVDGVDLGPSLLAAPSVDDYLGYWDEPGTFIAASREIASAYDEPALLDELAADYEDCVFVERESYEDPLYEGLYDLYEDCAGLEDMAVVVVAATPTDRSFIVFVEVQVVTEADLEALDQVLATFVADPAAF